MALGSHKPPLRFDDIVDGELVTRQPFSFSKWMRPVLWDGHYPNAHTIEPDIDAAMVENIRNSIMEWAQHADTELDAKDIALWSPSLGKFRKSTQDEHIGTGPFLLEKIIQIFPPHYLRYIYHEDSYDTVMQWMLIQFNIPGGGDLPIPQENAVGFMNKLWWVQAMSFSRSFYGFNKLTSSTKTVFGNRFYMTRRRTANGKKIYLSTIVDYNHANVVLKRRQWRAQTSKKLMREPFLNRISSEDSQILQYNSAPLKNYDGRLFRMTPQYKVVPWEMMNPTTVARAGTDSQRKALKVVDNLIAARMVPRGWDGSLWKLVVSNWIVESYDHKIMGRVYVEIMLAPTFYIVMRVYAIPSEYYEVIDDEWLIMCKLETQMALRYLGFLYGSKPTDSTRTYRNIALFNIDQDSFYIRTDVPPWEPTAETLFMKNDPRGVPEFEKDQDSNVIVKKARQPVLWMRDFSKEDIYEFSPCARRFRGLRIHDQRMPELAVKGMSFVTGELLWATPDMKEYAEWLQGGRMPIPLPRDQLIFRFVDQVSGMEGTWEVLEPVFNGLGIAEVKLHFLTDGAKMAATLGGMNFPV